MCKYADWKLEHAKCGVYGLTNMWLSEAIREGRLTRTEALENCTIYKGRCTFCPASVKYPTMGSEYVLNAMGARLYRTNDFQMNDPSIITFDHPRCGFFAEDTEEVK